MSIFSSIHLNCTFPLGGELRRLHLYLFIILISGRGVMRQKWREKQAIDFCNFLKVTVWEFALHVPDFNEIRVVGVIVLSEIVYFVQYGEKGGKEERRERGKDGGREHMEGGRGVWRFQSRNGISRDRATSSKHVCLNTKVSVVS